MFGMNPKQMQALMKKLGMKTTEIPAQEVIIKGEKQIVIKNPQVMLMEIQGQKTFQITGEITEEKTNEEDIKIIMEKTGCSREEAKKALEEEKDLAAAILKLSQNE